MDFDYEPPSDDFGLPPAVPDNEFQYDQVFDNNDNVLPDPDPVEEDALTYEH
jgi:hypothetical protein